MPTLEAEYTYAVVPHLHSTAGWQTRGSPYTVIQNQNFGNRMNARYRQKQTVAEKEKPATWTGFLL
jgi:hypothetical protein